MPIPTQIDFLDEQVAYNSSKLEEYHGWAPIGSKTDKPVWLIRKTFYNSSMQKTHHRFAYGTKSFNQVWDNRESLEYY